MYRVNTDPFHLIRGFQATDINKNKYLIPSAF